MKSFWASGGKILKLADVLNAPVASSTRVRNRGLITVEGTVRNIRLKFMPVDAEHIQRPGINRFELWVMDSKGGNISL